MKSLSSYKNPIELTHEELKYKFTYKSVWTDPRSISLQALMSNWTYTRRT